MSNCIVFLGAPGSGKGSQARRLSKFLGVDIISTGDLARDEVSNKTDLGKIISPYLEDGNLIPDEIILKMFQQWLSARDLKKGFIADGFPRTVAQAKTFDNLLGEDDKNKLKIIFLDVSLETIADRVVDRRICTNCKAIYNLKSKPPKTETECDLCNSALFHRDDDTHETIKKRHQNYQKLTIPILKYYGDRNLLINGNQAQKDVFSDIKAALK